MAATWQRNILLGDASAVPHLTYLWSAHLAARMIDHALTSPVFGLDSVAKGQAVCGWLRGNYSNDVVLRRWPSALGARRHLLSWRIYMEAACSVT
jgi:hypothetical protein